MAESTRAELFEQGNRLRKLAPRSKLGTRLDFDRDPVALLDSQNESRVPELVPVRWGRMSESPFAFYRGAAALMAHDLATSSVSGVRVQACGDAHLSNFGLFSSPERTVVFDLNDFDETTPAPWEWDVERLVASVAVAARASGFGTEAELDAARAAARAYRDSMDRAATLSTLENFHSGVSAETLLQLSADADGDRAARDRTITRAVTKAKKRTSEQALAALTTTGEGGELRIIEQPPLVVHVSRLPEDVLKVPDKYRENLQADVDNLVGRFHLVDFVRRVVGVGSVGTRAYIMLLVDSGANPLFLQVKEATRSVLEPFAGPNKYSHMGKRVVVGQRIMQAYSDRLLGWTSAGGRHYYVRTFRDMKGGFRIDRLSKSLLIDYATLCGRVLARAHVQSVEPALLAGYLGSGEAFVEAMAKFAVAYADQNELDYFALQAAIESGRVVVDQR